MPFSLSPTPHLRAESTVPGFFWTVVLALLPIVLVLHVRSGLEALRIFTVVSASAAAGEFLFRKILNQPNRLYDGSALATGLLFALLLPPGLPLWMAALGALFGIGMGKEIFGGLGQNPFNPTLVGIAFLWISFPVFRESSATPMLGQAGGWDLAAIFLGGFFLVLKRIIPWEMPLGYAGSFFLVSCLTPLASFEISTWSVIFLGAFFLTTDPSTMPLLKPARRSFAIAAGMSGALISRGGGLLLGVVHGILILNALAPLLDQFFKPRFKKLR